MSHPETKRRVMGRIDLASDGSAAGGGVLHNRVSTPPTMTTTTNSVRKGSHVRARVDMSAFADSSSASTSPSISADSYASNQQQYFGRPPIRTSAAASSSATSSPFLSAASSPVPSLSPSLNSRSGGGTAFSSLSHSNSSSNLVAGPSSSAARVVRSPSPVRQAKRSSVVLLQQQQDGYSHYAAASPSSSSTGLPQNGISLQPRARLASGGSGHARTSSSQQFSSAIPPSEGHARISSHTRNPSALAFANGSSHARVATGSTLSSFNSSASLAARSRSPSPHLVKAAAATTTTNPTPPSTTITSNTTAADRRASQGSATSSTVNSNSNAANTRQTSPAAVVSTPVARSLRIVNPASIATRPPLLTNTSSHSGVTSDAGSGSLPSPSFSSAMSRMPPFNYRDLSQGGGNGSGGWEEAAGDASSGTVGSPNQSLPLLSPPLELTPEAQEAKKNRKILDLEITNRSLLAINGGLEVVKLKHVREIKDLKKRLREGRGLGGKMGLGGADGKGDGQGADGIDEADRRNVDEDEDNDEEEEEEEDDDDDEEEAPLDTELEMAHNRCKTLIDNMVEEARRAILYRYQAEREGEEEKEKEKKKKGGNRVLHPVEVEMLQGGNDGEEEESMIMHRVGSDQGHNVAALLRKEDDDDIDDDEEEVGDAIETASV